MRFKLKGQRQAQLSRSADRFPSVFEPSVLQDSPVRCQKPVEYFPGEEVLSLTSPGTSAFPSPAWDSWETWTLWNPLFQDSDSQNEGSSSSPSCTFSPARMVIRGKFPTCVSTFYLLPSFYLRGGLWTKHYNSMIPAFKLLVQVDMCACHRACVNVRGQPGTVNALLVWLPRTKLRSLGSAGIIFSNWGIILAPGYHVLFGQWVEEMSCPVPPGPASLFLSDQD